MYVGSAESEEHDQILDCINVGPVPVGVNKFVFQAPAAAVDRIPAQDAIGVTVVLLTCSYLQKEFVRVGYYVNNEYATQELQEAPPAAVEWPSVVRSILADKPRVTRFPIPWSRDAPEMDDVPATVGNPDDEPAELELGVDEQDENDDGSVEEDEDDEDDGMDQDIEEDDEEDDGDVDLEGGEEADA